MKYMAATSKRSARARLLKLPTARRFWRSWLEDPALDIHLLTDLDAVDQQLGELRERGVTPHEAFAVVWWHCSGFSSVDRLALARRAGEMIVEQCFNLVSDLSMSRDDAKLVDQMWRADLAAADMGEAGGQP